MATDVFLSVGRPSNARQQTFVTAVEDLLRRNDLNPRTPGRTFVGNKQPLKLIEQCMRSCAGAVVVAYERIHIADGTDRRGADDSKKLENDLLPTVWNQVEATMAYTLGLPLLVLAERGLHSAALLEDKYDWTVQWVDLDPVALSTPAFEGVFRDWRGSVVTHTDTSGPQNTGSRDTTGLTIGQILGGLRPAQAWTAGAALFAALGALASYSYHLGATIAVPGAARTADSQPLSPHWVSDSAPQGILGNRVILSVGAVSDIHDTLNVFISFGGARQDTVRGLRQGQARSFLFDGTKYVLSVLDLDGGDGHPGSARLQVAVDE